MRARRILLALLAVAALVPCCGCARFSTRQRDESWTTPEGATYRAITTRVTATVFFDSHSELARFRASQTDKSQSAAVGSLESAASGTNAVKAVEAVGKGVVEGIKASVIPIP